ncbi:hypothetical protein [Streptomyces sp. NRRL S-1448]|uniref:hypothetical protein n=1 Tax=Streptomyces sp. NRRL S-1448 TaxID=1463883 RepID=UPI0004BF06B0|nr:hypothetical protein [Streptomyces sp. NRRL S-1448]
MTTDSDHAHREGYDLEAILADEDQVAACARANMAALVAELVARGCDEPWAGLEDGEADDEWPDCLQFPFECPPGYEGDIVMPGVPLEVVKGGENGGSWEVVHNGVPYAWSDLVDELSAFDAARRTIWANRDRLVAELIGRGLPLGDEDVDSDPDASGDSCVTYHLALKGRKVRVSIPDVAVGPGLAQEMYVEGYPYVWEEAVEAAVVGLTGITPGK